MGSAPYSSDSKAYPAWDMVERLACHQLEDAFASVGTWDVETGPGCIHGDLVVLDLLKEQV